MEFVEYQTPSAWKSKDFDDSSWIDILSNDQREELLMLAKSLPDNEDEWLNISKDDLALNFLKPLFIQTNKELEAQKSLALEKLETQVDELSELIKEKLLGKQAAL